ncbi:hypothetical protein DPMN_098230 [Dreissena polymorpha]|uniref:Uncharacterized protein n=1 Tax=Dreissena polymorpha TaxID=45954 RepID=A0A9D4R730_DREPO|nr:hypothetical protein DPMN_098230 [Dreissena polymorpha]
MLKGFVFRKCSQVVLIAEKVKNLHQKGDFKHLSTTFDTQLQQLIRKKDDFEENIKYLEKSYKKNLEEINALRKTINASLDQLEKDTKKELDTFLATIKTSIQTDIEHCNTSIKNITILKEDWLRKKDKTEALSLMTYRKCLDQSLKEEAVLQEMTTKNERTLTFYPDTTIQPKLSSLSGLGKILSAVKQSQSSKRTTKNTLTTRNNPKASSQSDIVNQTAPGSKVKKCNPESSSSRQYSPRNHSSQVSDPVSSSSHQLIQGLEPDAVSMPDSIIKVKNSEKYSVKIERDLSNCIITGICDTASGELLILDKANNCVKLLDQTYRVVAYCELPSEPWSMSSIDSSLVAVAVAKMQIHFIRLTNSQLIKDRTLTLEHTFFGIAYHQGNLYITDDEGLYHYTVDGRLVRQMYKDASYGIGNKTIAKQYMSPNGSKIFRNSTIVRIFFLYLLQ